MLQLDCHSIIIDGEICRSEILILHYGYGIVKPDRRNQGVGKEMLRQGLVYAFEIYGADRVTLGVYDKNENAIACYTSVGFRETGVRETYQVCGGQYEAFEMEATDQ